MAHHRLKDHDAWLNEALQRNNADNEWLSEVMGTRPLMPVGDGTQAYGVAGAVEGFGRRVTSHGDVEMSAAFFLDEGTNDINEAIVSGVADDGGQMPIDDIVMSADLEESYDEHLLPYHLASHPGKFNQIELDALTAELHAFQCAHGLSKKTMQTLLKEAPLLTESHRQLRVKLLTKLPKVLPEREKYKADKILHMIRLRYIPRAEKLPLPIPLCVVILLHHRQLIVTCQWARLGTAMSKNTALPQAISENSALFDAAGWLRYRFAGFHFVQQRRCVKLGAHIHNWTLGEIMELELLWLADFRKYQRSSRKKFEAAGASYGTNNRSWDLIAMCHSSRTISECKAFWEAEYGF
jgi:hypothetical protein